MCFDLSRLSERFDLDAIAAVCLLLVAAIVGFVLGYGVCLFDVLDLAQAL